MKVTNIFKIIFSFLQVRYLLMIMLLFFAERSLYPSYNSDIEKKKTFSQNYFEPYKPFEDSNFVFPTLPSNTFIGIDDSVRIFKNYRPGWEDAELLFKKYKPVSLSQYLFWSMFPDYINDTTKVAVVEIVSTFPSRDTPKSFTSKHYTIPVMGRGRLSDEELFTFFRMNNDSVPAEKVRELIDIYLAESTTEGVNHDLAFIQMCHETGFLRFDGTVHPDQNNYCGLGTVNARTPGESFYTPQEGVRAHIQHLKAYGSDDHLNNELVDQRFYFVQRGTATKLHQLTGKWAADPEYDHKIVGLMKRAEKQTGKPVI